MRPIEIEFVSSLAIDGSERNVSVGKVTSSGSRSLTLQPTDRLGLYNAHVNGKEIPVFLQCDGISTIYLSMRGYRYEVRVRRSSDHDLLEKLRQSPVMRSLKVKISAPMPGLLKSVVVAEGDQVAKGATLFTLEAMKMENIITAPINGIARNLAAKEGQTVEKGLALCVIEPVA